MFEASLPKTPSRKGWLGEGFGVSESRGGEDGQGVTDGDVARTRAAVHPLVAAVLAGHRALLTHGLPLHGHLIHRSAQCCPGIGHAVGGCVRSGRHRLLLRVARLRRRGPVAAKAARAGAPIAGRLRGARSGSADDGCAARAAVPRPDEAGHLEPLLPRAVAPGGARAVGRRGPGHTRAGQPVLDAGARAGRRRVAQHSVDDRPPPARLFAGVHLGASGRGHPGRLARGRVR
eukprot:scaffold7684_cov119-Isochrysis_galbana.AAC.4